MGAATFETILDQVDADYLTGTGLLGDTSGHLADRTPYLGKLALGYITELHTSGRTLIKDCSVSWGYPAIITERGSEI